MRISFAPAVSHRRLAVFTASPITVYSRRRSEPTLRLNTKWQEEGRPVLGIGIGINFGEVFAGNVASDRRLEYTVIGDAVNTAKRLCDTAGANEIIISEPFYQQLKQPPKVDPLEPIQVKGKSKKIPVYRVKR